ncbi:MAG TPA: tetratricopeptide repeat protein [Terriglobales bacterium]|nr:tetratricopeptide repeat protein [Terriglobales bacterium]
MVSSRNFLLAVVLLAAAALADDGPVSLLAQGRVDQAIASLEGRLNSAPDDAQSHNLLCRSYFALGEWNRGITECEKAVELEPHNSLYHLWLGRIYGEKADSVVFLTAAGLAKKVREEFETAVQLNPNGAEARTDLAEFYLEAPGIMGGGHEKAEAQAKVLEKIDPPMAHWVRGRIAEKKKEFDTAEREYRAAIEASNGGAYAWFNLALFYRHQQKWEEMEQTVHRAAAAPIDRPEILMESGEILIRAGRDFPGAARLLRRYLAGTTVEQGPAFKAHYWLGTVLEKQGDKEGAEQEYRAALALARDFSRAQEALQHLSR